MLARSRITCYSRAWQSTIDFPGCLLGGWGVGYESKPNRRSDEWTEPPLVSCIMPTANRRHFVPEAIRLFMAQDYPETELIILDDGEDDVRDLIPKQLHIRYLRLDRPQSIGAKRNLGCELPGAELSLIGMMTTGTRRGV